jgi:hypothetical protein
MAQLCAALTARFGGWLSRLINFGNVATPSCGIRHCASYVYGYIFSYGFPLMETIIWTYYATQNKLLTADLYG